MKILHIASIKNNPFNGVCVAVPQHIIHQGKQADVALLNIQKCQIDGIQHQFFYEGKNWKHDVSSEFQKPDLVVFHEVYHIEFAKIARTLVKRRIPYIIVPHGCLVKSAQQKKWWKKKLANLLFFRQFIVNCKALQCLSENELKNTVFKNPKFIATNGIEVPNKYKEFFNEDKMQITYIGRLEIVPKGLDLLLQAIKQVVAKPNVINRIGSIDLYGPEWNGRYAEVETLNIKNGVKSIVTLHPAVGGEEKKEILPEYNKESFSNFLEQSSSLNLKFDVYNQINPNVKNQRALTEDDLKYLNG